MHITLSLAEMKFSCTEKKNSTHQANTCKPTVKKINKQQTTGPNCQPLLINAAVLKASKSEKPAYLNLLLNYYTLATKD